MNNTPDPPETDAGGNAETHPEDQTDIRESIDQAKLVEKVPGPLSPLPHDEKS